MIICFDVPGMRHVTNVIVIFYFGLFFDGQTKNVTYRGWGPHLKTTIFSTTAPTTTKKNKIK